MPTKGFLETVGAFQARGWAYDTEAPERKLIVEVLLRGEPVGTAIADLYRADLAEGGIGTGDHAFVVNFANQLSEDDLSDISVRIVKRDGDHQPLSVLAGPPAAARRELAPHPLEFRGVKSDDQQEPIFVLGARRSGTSAMAQALLKLFPGYLEGNFIDLLAHLSVGANKFYEEKTEEKAVKPRTMISTVPEKYVNDALDATLIGMIRDLFTGGRWVDKTPNADMIHLAPRLKNIWPKSKFIFMKRRFFENYQSRIRKFPHYGIKRQCGEWSDAMATWHRVRSNLAGSAVEIDQRYLSAKPEEAAFALRDFLNMTDLETKRLAQALSNDRPERSSALIDQPVDLESMQWGPAETQEFKLTCLQWMDAFGYSTDATYFKPGSENQKFVLN